MFYYLLILLFLSHTHDTWRGETHWRLLTQHISSANAQNNAELPNTYIIISKRTTPSHGANEEKRISVASSHTLSTLLDSELECRNQLSLFPHRDCFIKSADAEHRNINCKSTSGWILTLSTIDVDHARPTRPTKQHRRCCQHPSSSTDPHKTEREQSSSRITCHHRG